MPTVPSFDWVKTGWATLLIALVTFTTGYGARGNEVSRNTSDIKEIHEKYVTKDQFQQILTQHMKMMEKMDSMSQKTDTKLDNLSQKLEDFRLEQARLHGGKR